VSAGALEDAGDGEFYDFKYFNASRNIVVFVDGDEVVREDKPENDIRLLTVDEDDTPHASDRCDECSALLACQRCIDLVDEVRERFAADGGDV